MLPEEVWLPVPSVPSLEASSHGRIRVAGRVAPTFGVITTASKAARSKHFARHIKRIGNIKVHRAVCEAFHGEAPFAGAVVSHLNENGLDNRPANLTWATQRENLNMPRFIEYCRSRTGDNHPRRKSRDINPV